MRDTSRVVDKTSHAGIEQLAQPLSGKIVARRDLDRARGDQFCHPVPLLREVPGAVRLPDRGTHQPKPRLREIT